MVKDRLPEIKDKGNYRAYYITEMGFTYFDKYDGWEKNYNIEWFLEEIELPSEEEVVKACECNSKSESNDFIVGVECGAIDAYNYILNKLK